MLWRNIISITVILILIGVIVWNQIDWKNDKEYNVVDVTGDTSVEGVAISPPDMTVWKEEDPMLPIELPNLEGKTISIYDSSKPIILINFWATWCPPCKEEMPALEQLQKNKKDVIDLFAVNVTSKEASEKIVHDYQKEHQFGFEILLDKDGEFFDALHLVNIPVSFFVDTEKREIVKRVDGPMDYEQMVQIIEDISSGS